VLDVDLLKRHLRSWHLLPPTEAREIMDPESAGAVLAVREGGDLEAVS
jgi:hypothetical protein